MHLIHAFCPWLLHFYSITAYWSLPQDPYHAKSRYYSPAPLKSPWKVSFYLVYDRYCIEDHTRLSWFHPEALPSAGRPHWTTCAYNFATKWLITSKMRAFQFSSDCIHSLLCLAKNTSSSPQKIHHPRVYIFHYAMGWIRPFKIYIYIYLSLRYDNKNIYLKYEYLFQWLKKKKSSKVE